MSFRVYTADNGIFYKTGPRKKILMPELGGKGQRTAHGTPAKALQEKK